MDLSNIQPNKPMANLEDYVILCYGVGKSGKTTLFYELAKEHFKGDLSKALLVATEKGYKALRDIRVVDINSWKDAEELANGLLEQKDDLSFKWIGIDTLDYLYQYCAEHVVRRERIAKKDSKIQTISDIAWGQGWALVEELMTKWLHKIISGGYGLFMITHEGTKTFKSRDGSEFDKTTLSLPTRVRNSIINMCDFILYISVEKVKEGDNLKDNRVIYLRSDSDIEAGSRFTNIPETIPYDAQKFLNAFSEAVLNVYEHDELAIEEASIEQAIKREEKSKEYISNETTKNVVEDWVAKISDSLKEMSSEMTDKIKKAYKENFGSVNYKKYEEENLEKAYNIIVQVKEQG